MNIAFHLFILPLLLFFQFTFGQYGSGNGYYQQANYGPGPGYGQQQQPSTPDIIGEFQMFIQGE
jgi:hypothetical protein